MEESFKSTTLKKYLSFNYVFSVAMRAKSHRFREWLNLGGNSSLETKLSQTATDLLGYFAYETVAQVIISLTVSAPHGRSLRFTSTLLIFSDLDYLYIRGKNTVCYEKPVFTQIEFVCTETV